MCTVGAVAKQVVGSVAAAEGGGGAVRQPDARGAVLSHLGCGDGRLPPLPLRGDRLTEEEVHERFGTPRRGGIRPSLTSTDIVLVRNARNGRVNAGEGGRIMHRGTHYEGRPSQMIRDNLRLARSGESGSRVMYFVREGGRLRFCGLVECVGHGGKAPRLRQGAPIFELRPADASSGRGFLEAPAPDLDAILAVERKISDCRRLASRTGLLAALPAGFDPAGLDRILEYLEDSAKITIKDGRIRWAFGGSGPREGPDAGGKGDRPPAVVAAAARMSDGILSMEERLSPDLDNDLPYSEEIERVIADCEAGRPIGRTYTAEEYLRHLDREYGIGALEHRAE